MAGTPTNSNNSRESSLRTTSTKIPQDTILSLDGSLSLDGPPPAPGYVFVDYQGAYPLSLEREGLHKSAPWKRKPRVPTTFDPNAPVDFDVIEFLEQRTDDPMGSNVINNTTAYSQAFTTSNYIFSRKPLHQIGYRHTPTWGFPSFVPRSGGRHNEPAESPADDPLRHRSPEVAG